MKIAIYAISKNEEQFIQRCLESCKGADYFVLADTGSTDQTVHKAWSGAIGDRTWINGEQYPEGAVRLIPHIISVQPFRFDDARNTALSLVPSDVDVCISLDIDEIMMPGWREEIEAAWTPEATRMSYMFDWGSGLQFKSDKIHARNGYRWVKPCHECLVPTRITEKFVYTDKLLIKHLPDNTKSRADYFPLLEVAYNEHPTDPRALLYFGRELYFRGDFDRAIDILNKYIEISTWQAEKAYAVLLIGDICTKKGDFSTALVNYHEAMRIWPDYRDPYLRASFFYHTIKDWEKCLNYAETALKITKQSYHYFEDQKSWSWYPYDLAALSSFYLNDKEKALKYGRKAIEMNPSDNRLINNLEFYK